jgi:hypothetical protein
MRADRFEMRIIEPGAAEDPFHPWMEGKQIRDADVRAIPSIRIELLPLPWVQVQGIEWTKAVRPKQEEREPADELPEISSEKQSPGHARSDLDQLRPAWEQGEAAYSEVLQEEVVRKVVELVVLNLSVSIDSPDLQSY